MRHQQRPDRSAAALARIVRRALEEAAAQGLCREGQVEFACGRMQAERPDWPANQRLAFVHRTASAARP